jgi:hypothetical protein
MMRIPCFTRTSSFRDKELSVTAVLVLAMIVMVALFVVALIGLGRLSAKWAAEQPSFEASLAKNLPPDLQANMKPIQPGLVTSVAITVVALPIIVAGLTATGKARAALFVGFGLVGAVACAVWTASIARTWLNRRYPGEVLVDLSPYPLAGAVRRSSWLVGVACAPMLLFAFIKFALVGFQTPGDWLFGAFWVAFVPLALLTNLMYSDRVWLAERGLYFGGRLYPWDGFERFAWTDDGRAFALRRKGRWRLQRWTVVPVPAGSREAAEGALRQVMPAPNPTQ